MTEKVKHNEFSQLDFLEFFTIPFQLQTEQYGIEILPENVLKTVVVVGRFQPLHYGHLYLIKQAAQIGCNVIIGIGSANVKNEDNPYTPEQREYMLKKALKRDEIAKVKKIVYLDDNPDDELWIANTLKKTGKVDAVIGNNDWVNNCFEFVGIQSINVPLLQRGIYEGKRIRSFLRSVNKL